MPSHNRLQCSSRMGIFCH